MIHGQLPAKHLCSPGQVYSWPSLAHHRAAPSGIGMVISEVIHFLPRRFQKTEAVVAEYYLQTTCNAVDVDCLEAHPESELSSSGGILETETERDDEIRRGIQRQTIRESKAVCPREPKSS